MLCMNTVWTIIIIVLLVIIAVLAVLYFLGRKMQGQQADAQAAMEAAKQTVSMLIIDKKKMKLQDAGLPKMVTDQVPWYSKAIKYPVVKAKVGPKVATLLCDAQVYEMLPVKTECKVAVSGIYITELKSIRGQAIQAPKKKGLLAKLRK